MRSSTSSPSRSKWRCSTRFWRGTTIVQSARDLDVFMTMRTRINNVLSSCYGSLRQIRTIKRSLPLHALNSNTLVTSLVCSRMDYCNVVFAGLSAFPDCNLLSSVIKPSNCNNIRILLVYTVVIYGQSRVLRSSKFLGLNNVCTNKRRQRAAVYCHWTN